MFTFLYFEKHFIIFQYFTFGKRIIRVNMAETILFSAEEFCFLNFRKIHFVFEKKMLISKFRFVYRAMRVHNIDSLEEH